MRIILLRKAFVLCLLFCINLSAQCTITTSTDASTLNCGSGILSSCGGTITVGNGMTPVSLKMDDDLDLTACGAIQLIIDNATLDFSTANKRLYLSEGSSIIFINGGTLNPPGGTGGGCTGNDRVYIGGVLLAACNGGAGILGFEELISFGGTGKAVSNSPVCPGNAIHLTATPPPNGSYEYSWSGPDLSATPYSSSPNYTFLASMTPSSPVYTVSMKRTSDGKIITANTTVTIEMPAITTQPINQLDCEGASVKFKVIASGSGLMYTWQYKKPSETNFTPLVGTVSNTSYPSTGEIKIGNVGSAQYPDGTQFQVVVSNGSCSVTSETVTLSVNEILNISPVSTSVTQCYGTDYTYTVTTSYPSNVVSYQWKKSVTSGVWTVVNDGGAYSGATTNALTITGGTPAESAQYRVYVTFNNTTTQCNVDSASRTRKITFLPLLTTPIVTITQPTCNDSVGTIAITVQSDSDTYSFDGGVTYQISNIKSGMAEGFHDVIIKNLKGCLSPTTTCEISSSTSTWDGTTWINGTPDINRKVVFEKDFNSTSDIEACSCKIENGANVVINSAHTLKVANELDVLNGTLTFENNASLVQINDAAINTGVINYKRHTTPIRRYDFTYWSSPVEGQTLKNLSPNTLFDKYYGFNPNSGWLIHYFGKETMQKGKGYSVRAPQNFSITMPVKDCNPVFIGVPNNGVVSLLLGANKLNMLGNPYPSAIDANAFLDANAAVLEGTLYFWTHQTAPVISISGTEVYNYSNNDYATYNRTGSVTLSKSAISGGSVPLGKIAAGQGFFAPSNANGGILNFNNSMRLSGGDQGSNNAQFFKSNNIKDKTTPFSIKENSRVWLNLTSKEGVFKQTLIGYINGATNDYDAGFDGKIFTVDQNIQFYSLNHEMPLAIQGRRVPFDEEDFVPLGYKSEIQGEYQISIDHIDGVLVDKKLLLEDAYLQKLHDLNKEPYLFTTEKGTFNNRFILRYTDKNIEAKIVNDPMLNKDDLVSVFNNQIKINSYSGLISKVYVYNILGQLVFQKDKIEAKDYLIQHLNLSHQVLVVKVVLTNNQVVSTKIVF